MVWGAAVSFWGKGFSLLRQCFSSLGDVGGGWQVANFPGFFRWLISPDFQVVGNSLKKLKSFKKVKKVKNVEAEKAPSDPWTLG